MQSVLIIDDDKDTTDIMRMSLEFCGYKVSIAENTDDGLSNARSSRPDLILLDYMLPGTLGAGDLVAQLKTEKIPSKILLMSGIGDHTEKAQQLGINASIQKPFDPDLLIAKLKEL